MRQVSPSIYWLFCLLLFAANQTVSQNITFNYRHFSVEDGLASRFVNNVVQDDQGFIWLGTSVGVSRFDGRHFKTYQGAAKNVRPFVNSFLYKAVGGQIWVNYDNRLVNILDPITNTFTSLEEFFPEIKGKNVSLINTGSKNEIWGTIGDEFLFRYNGTFQVSQPVRLPKNGGRTYRYYIPTPWGTFFLIDEGCLDEFNFDGQAVNHFPNDWMHGSPIFKDSSLLILSIQYKKGTELPIHLWKLQKNLPPQPVKLTKDGKPFSLGNVTNIAATTGLNLDADGNIWIVLPGKLMIFDKNGELLASEGDQNGYWGRFESRQLFFDAQNQAWISAKEGIYAMSIVQKAFRKLMQSSEIGFSMRGITELPNGNLLACSYAGLFKIDTRTGIHSKISDDICFGAKKVANNRIWLGAHSNKTQQLNPTTLELTKNTIYPDISISDELLRPFEDSITSKIYYGSRRGGLLFFNDKTRLIEPYQQLNQFKELANVEILDLLVTQACIWVATSNGLYKMDRELGIVDRVNHFSVNYIYHISRDTGGIFWLATGGGGLLRWNSLDNTYQQHSTANGLFNNTIYAACDDGLGYLWLPSNYGLMRFQKSTGFTSNFLPSDGIAHEEFNNSSHYQAADGTLYLGGLNGITAFKPSEIVSKQFDAPLVITELKVFHGNQIEDRTAGFLSQKNIIIQPDEKFFTVEFALLDYQNSKQLYAWKLEGLDKDWTYQAENNIRLNALPYGNFTLKIKAQATGSNWSKNELAIPVIIVRPFYKTWNFALVCAAVAVLLTFFLIRWRTRRLRREKERLSDLVEARTRELIGKNAELESLNKTKDRLFTIIAHDLRSPLVTLGGLARKVAFLIRQNRMDEVQGLGETVENSVATVRNLLDNLLKWSILQDGKFPHHPELLAANEIASEVIGLYNTVAEAKGVQLVYQNVGDPVVYADRNSVSTIIRNLVDNALKFTHENGKVELSVENQDNDCYILVSDSGIGIPLAELGNIFTLKNSKGGQGTKGEKGNGLGLTLCRELVEINEGSIEAYNQTGGGAKFVVRLPAVISAH